MTVYNLARHDRNGEFMNPSLQTLLQAVDADKARLDTARPLPLHTLEALREQLTLEWTYHSNALEGNTLTPSETKGALDGATVAGEPSQAQREAANHRDAIRYVEDIVAGNETLSVQHIQRIHRLLLAGIDDTQAGRCREQNVPATGTCPAPVDFSQVPAQLAALIEWRAHAEKMHPLARAAELQARFVTIHPFMGGNRTIGRLLSNLDLMKAGYPPAIIRGEDRATYDYALERACATEDVSALTLLVAEATHRTLTTYLGSLGAAD